MDGLESKIPAERVAGNGRPPQPSGVYVACVLDRARRTYWNFALQRAADWARMFSLPLLVVEILPLEAHSTTHARRFLMDGMASTARRLLLGGVTYHPYVETAPGSASGLLEEVSARASVLVRDTESGPAGDLLVETVASSYLLPDRIVASLSESPEAERLRRARREFRKRLLDFPERNPLARLGIDPLPGLPPRLTARWPGASGTLLAGDAEELAASPIESTEARDWGPGGADQARENWRELLLNLAAGGEEDPAEPGSDLDAIREHRLRRHLRAGHLSPHQVVAESMRRLEWTPARLAATDDVPPRRWWGLPGRLEALLDELLLAKLPETDDGR